MTDRIASLDHIISPHCQSLIIRKILSLSLSLSISHSLFVIQSHHQSTHYHLSNKNNRQNYSSEILVKITNQHCYLASFKLNQHHQKIDALTSQFSQVENSTQPHRPSRYLAQSTDNLDMPIQYQVHNLTSTLCRIPSYSHCFSLPLSCTFEQITQSTPHNTHLK